MVKTENWEKDWQLASLEELQRITRQQNEMLLSLKREDGCWCKVPFGKHTPECKRIMEWFNGGRKQSDEGTADAAANSQGSSEL